jgi:CRP-like cAMP-binding protein
MNDSSISFDLTSSLMKKTFERQNKLPLDSRLLWKIEQGIVRTLTWSREGIPTTLGLWGPGDVVGRPLSQTEPYEVECLEPTTAIALPLHLWVHEMDAILLYVQQTENLLNIISHQTVYLRLLEFLAWLAHKFGCEVETGKLIMLRLTHQEIAETIAASRVTVTRMFGILEQEGKIIRSNNQLILPHSHNTSNKNNNKRKLIMTSHLEKNQGENYEYIS